MKIGLKQNLNNLVEKYGYITLDQAYEYGKGLGAKQKTVERSLNPSLSPNIQTVYNDKHQIKGYKCIGAKTNQPFKCCYSIGVFGTHGSECITKTIKVGQLQI